MPYNYPTVPVSNHRHTKWMSRRDFLNAGAAAVIASLGLPRSWAQSGMPPHLQSVKSRIVDIGNNRVLSGIRVNARRLRKMLRQGLIRYSGRDTESAAWRSIVGDGERIVIKATGIGGEGIATAEPLVRNVVEGLIDAGFNPSQIKVADVNPLRLQNLDVEMVEYGWTSDPVNFGEFKCPMARWVFEADTIINIPFLTDHNIFSLAGCMLNLAHPLLKHPATYYSGRGTDAVVALAACEAIRPKVKLHLLNALRVVYAGGPAHREQFTHSTCRLMLSDDPVALDWGGFLLVDHLRLHYSAAAQVGKIPDYIMAAAKQGVGRVGYDHVNISRITP